MVMLGFRQGWLSFQTGLAELTVLVPTRWVPP